MALPPLPEGSSRNKIEFLYKHMNSGESGSGSALPIIQGRFMPNNDTGWNADLDGFFIKYDAPSYVEDGDMDIMPLIRPKLESDGELVRVFFNISAMARLSGFQGELGFYIVLADEQGNVIKENDGYLRKLELKSTTVHGKASELGQRVTVNETGILLIGKDTIKDKQKVFPHLLIQADPVYAADSGRTNKGVVSDLYLHSGDVVIIGLDVSSIDLTFVPREPSSESGSPVPN